MLAPKPPLSFTAYAIGHEPMKVRYVDGAFLHAENGAPINGEAWITSAVEPKRFVRLGDAYGEVTGRELVGARTCVITEVRGLRGATTVLRLWVDEEVGSIVRMERVDDPAPLVVLDDFDVEAG
jgi:hypothetical protein